MKKILGTCSLCGGRVTVATVFLSTKPPVPHCETCGARPKRPHGAVIDMESKPNIRASLDLLSRRGWF